MSILRSPELLLNVTGNFCDRNLGPNDEAVGSEVKRLGSWHGSCWKKNKKESNNAFLITSSSSSSENKKTERGLNAVIFLCVWQREQVDLSGEDDDLPAAPDGALIRLWSWINATLVYYVCL